MQKEDYELCQATALRVREHIIRLATDGGCFIGASLSCVDLLAYLYTQFLNVNQDNLDDPQRDYFFLSKGHDVPALYGLFVELGWLAPERLSNHLKTYDNIYWHPHRAIPGVEFHSGSLGHLLPVAVGVALDCKLRGQRNRVIVMTGDGELNEGSNWEALLVARAYRLDNLVVLVDRNGFQANAPTEVILPLEPLAKKLEAFGCRTSWLNGHDFGDMDTTFNLLPFDAGRPSAILAQTVRGKGLPSLENRADRWFCNFSAEEVAALLRELHGERRDALTSNVLVVR